MELDLSKLTLDDFFELERLSGRPMSWWLAFTSGDHPLETAADVLAVLCVSRHITEIEARRVSVAALVSDGD